MKAQKTSEADDIRQGEIRGMNRVLVSSVIIALACMTATVLFFAV